MQTRFKLWIGRSGERRVYVNTRYARDLPRSLARFADGVFFTASADGKVEVLGQGDVRRAAGEAVADLFGITTFDDAVKLASN